MKRKSVNWNVRSKFHTNSEWSTVGRFVTVIHKYLIEIEGQKYFKKTNHNSYIVQKNV